MTILKNQKELGTLSNISRNQLSRASLSTLNLPAPFGCEDFRICEFPNVDMTEIRELTNTHSIAFEIL